jgi:hypothetical protein
MFWLVPCVTRAGAVLICLVCYSSRGCFDLFHVLLGQGLFWFVSYVIQAGTVLICFMWYSVAQAGAVLIGLMCYSNRAVLIYFMHYSSKGCFDLFHVLQQTEEFYAWVRLIKQNASVFDIDWLISGILLSFTCCIMSISYLENLNS